MKLLFCIILTLLSLPQLFAQDINVRIVVFEEGATKPTPVMACITHTADSVVHIPPDGDTVGPATFPNPFFTGTDYSSNKNWVGPVRMMNGKGGVNQERTYVYGMNPTLPYWKEPVMYQTSGDFSIRLRPGKWRISLQHGNEFIPITEEFVLNGRKKNITKTFTLKRWIDLPKRGWYSGDVHAHHALDKPEFKEYLLQFAKAEDVHLVNMLEMGDRQNTYFKAGTFGKDTRVCRDNICLAFGQEEPRSDYGHIIGLNIDTLARDTAHYNHYDLVFNKIHTAPAALVGYAHFAYRGEGVTKGMAFYAPTKQIDFVELLQNTQLNQEDYYDYLNIGFRISAAAGSDFPWGSTIGDGRVFVYTGNKFSADAWFKGLKQGNTFVSNGPALFLEVDGHIPGTEIRVVKGQQLSVSVKAFSNKKIGSINRVEMYNNDGLLISEKNASGADSIEINISHAVTKSQWMTAVVFCDNVAVAHTSPVYILLDGQPIFDRQKGPAIIAKQMRILDEVIADENAKTTPDKGILERVAKAKSYYNNLSSLH